MHFLQRKLVFNFFQHLCCLLISSLKLHYLHFVSVQCVHNRKVLSRTNVLCPLFFSCSLLHLMHLGYVVCSVYSRALPSFRNLVFSVQLHSTPVLTLH